MSTYKMGSPPPEIGETLSYIYMVIRGKVTVGPR